MSRLKGPQFNDVKEAWVAVMTGKLIEVWHPNASISQQIRAASVVNDILHEGLDAYEDAMNERKAAYNAMRSELMEVGDPLMRPLFDGTNSLSEEASS